MIGVGCLTLLTFVLGYSWAAGWVGEASAVEASVAHCFLGAGTLGISAALGLAVAVRKAPHERLVAELDTPKGRITLASTATR